VRGPIGELQRALHSLQLQQRPAPVVPEAQLLFDPRGARGRESVAAKVCQLQTRCAADDPIIRRRALKNLSYSLTWPRDLAVRRHVPHPRRLARRHRRLPLRADDLDVRILDRAENARAGTERAGNTEKVVEQMLAE
jgi:hypothetical protein